MNRNPRFSRYARLVEDRPAWHYSVALWLIHGLLDGFVTVAAVVLFRDTTVESNPYLAAHLSRAHLASAANGHSLLPYWEPLALKLLAVGVAAGALLIVARTVPRRVFVGFSLTLTASGAFIVLNNLVALRGLAA